MISAYKFDICSLFEISRFRPTKEILPGVEVSYCDRSSQISHALIAGTLQIIQMRYFISLAYILFSRGCIIVVFSHMVRCYLLLGEYTLCVYRV